MLRTFFETRTPYRCAEADDGLSAIRAVEESRCELVVLDLIMPNMTGVVAASILRRMFPTVKIVGYSAQADDADLKNTLLATKNFDAVLSKLDGLEQLLETVKRLV